ncbi:MAG TPA: hypothetical protein EYG89_04515, partial [Bacteroidia bacterium]|nr:hypothetical protein [Bacteroidia bacterium]
MKKIFSTLLVVFGLSTIFSVNIFANLFTFRAGPCPVEEITFYQYNRSDGSLDRGYGIPFKNNGINVRIPARRT